MRPFKSSSALVFVLCLSLQAAEFADGPLRVSLRMNVTEFSTAAPLSRPLEPAELSVAEVLELECAVTVPAELKVILPGAEVELGDWTLAAFAKEPPELLDSGDVRHVLRYALEPFVPGTYTLPILVIAADEWSVETPATEVVVLGVLEAPHKATLRELAKEPKATGNIWPIVAFVVLVFGAGLWFGTTRKPPYVPSHQTQALAAIEAAADLDELAAALRTWAPHLSARLDAFRFRPEDASSDIGDLICELREELS